VVCCFTPSLLSYIAGRRGYWPELRFDMVVVAVAHRGLGPDLGW
jgi:hypothetical protein